MNDLTGYFYITVVVMFYLLKSLAVFVTRVPVKRSDPWRGYLVISFPGEERKK